MEGIRFNLIYFPYFIRYAGEPDNFVGGGENVGIGLAIAFDHYSKILLLNTVGWSVIGFVGRMMLGGALKKGVITGALCGGTILSLSGLLLAGTVARSYLQMYAINYGWYKYPVLNWLT